MVKIHQESLISKIHWMNAVIWRHFGPQSCVAAPIEWTSTTVCFIVFCQFRYFKFKCEKWKAWGFYQCMVFISFYINSNLCVFHLEQITYYLVKWYRWTRASWFYLYMYYWGTCSHWIQSSYCGISLVRRGQCSCIVKMLLVRKRRKFVVNWFIALECKTIHYFVKLSCERKFVGKCKPRNPRTLIHHKLWWFHSSLIFCHYV